MTRHDSRQPPQPYARPVPPPTEPPGVARQQAGVELRDERAGAAREPPLSPIALSRTAPARLACSQHPTQARSYAPTPLAIDKSSRFAREHGPEFLGTDVARNGDLCPASGPTRRLPRAVVPCAG